MTKSILELARELKDSDISVAVSFSREPGGDYRATEWAPVSALAQALEEAVRLLAGSMFIDPATGQVLDGDEFSQEIAAFLARVAPEGKNGI